MLPVCALLTPILYLVSWTTSPYNTAVQALPGSQFPAHPSQNPDLQANPVNTRCHKPPRHPETQINPSQAVFS
ncbi:hypothetical protein N658DRAFT_495182 [Parathielavia hyrcaniae]|uniref:Uncharacterized protein n=1 Tax=Parathielavia hyrcaniae TaxID=113614 RepID=A0AAN6Q433_9PEZI|nr:hypothetical protein N658DRAFT_495182 [Parathielavia hyrcaniae]